MQKSKINIFEKQRREVAISDLIFYFYLPIVLLILVWVGFILLHLYTEIGLEILTIFSIITSYILLRFISIGAVLMYKAYAPLSMRDNCRFEPSCSTYMIIALKTYGLIIGTILGIRRITRCKPPNGGVDLPTLFIKHKRKGD